MMNCTQKLAQRKLSKRMKGSNNYYKQKLVVAKIHEKIRNQRDDFLHQESRRLVNTYDIICVETLDLVEMMKTKYFSKQVSDISYNKFLHNLSYKCEDSGKTLHKVNKYYASSKICSVIDRDHNAAINIATKGMMSCLIDSIEAGTALLA